MFPSLSTLVTQLQIRHFPNVTIPQPSHARNLREILSLKEVISNWKNSGKNISWKLIAKFVQQI